MVDNEADDDDVSAKTSGEDGGACMCDAAVISDEKEDAGAIATVASSVGISTSMT